MSVGGFLFEIHNAARKKRVCSFVDNRAFRDKRPLSCVPRDSNVHAGTSVAMASPSTCRLTNYQNSTLVRPYKQVLRCASRKILAKYLLPREMHIWKAAPIEPCRDVARGIEQDNIK